MIDWIAGYRGELAALTSALLWAMSSILYGRVGQRVPPLQLNVLKGVVAIAFIGLTLLLRGAAMPELPLTSLLLLAASGVLGISLGDTAFFNTLNRLGPRRTLLLQTLAPSITAVLAVVFLEEVLTGRATIGILLILLGVAWVIRERTAETPVDAAKLARDRTQGIIWGTIAAFAQAGGAVLSRAALAETTVSPLVAALVRLVAGVAVLPLWMSLLPNVRPSGWKSLGSARLWGFLLLASFLGTYLAIWLQQTSLKFALAGVSQTLSATSPIFVLPLAAWTGDRVSLRAVLGALVAVSGVALLFS